MNNLTIEEYQRILARNQFSLSVLSDRVGMLTLENVELMSIVDELQHDLSEARGVLSDLQASAEVESNRADVHPIPNDPAAVPSR